jgi:hypothetical protein
MTSTWSGTFWIRGVEAGPTGDGSKATHQLAAIRRVRRYSPKVIDNHCEGTDVAVVVV